MLIINANVLWWIYNGVGSDINQASTDIAKVNKNMDSIPINNNGAHRIASKTQVIPVKSHCDVKTILAFNSNDDMTTQAMNHTSTIEHVSLRGLSLIASIRQYIARIIKSVVMVVTYCSGLSLVLSVSFSFGGVCVEPMFNLISLI